MLGHFPICIQKACLCNSSCCLLLSHVTFLVQEGSKCPSAAVLPCSSASFITFNLKPIVHNTLICLLHIPLWQQIYFQQTHNHCMLLTNAHYWTPSVRYNKALFRSLWKWVMCWQCYTSSKYENLSCFKVIYMHLGTIRCRLLYTLSTKRKCVLQFGK